MCLSIKEGLLEPDVDESICARAAGYNLPVNSITSKRVLPRPKFCGHHQPFVRCCHPLRHAFNEPCISSGQRQSRLEKMQMACIVTCWDDCMALQVFFGWWAIVGSFACNLCCWCSMRFMFVFSRVALRGIRWMKTV